MKWYPLSKRVCLNVVALALACLVVEQLIYCFTVTGYFLGIISSPVFWGLESIACFIGLWHMNRSSPKDNRDMEAFVREFQYEFQALYFSWKYQYEILAVYLTVIVLLWLFLR